MKSKYAMTEQQVESLAGEYASASVETARVSGTYLRVLVLATQAILGKVKRGRIARDAQLEVLADVSGKYYAAVLRGVTTPDIEPAPTLSREEQTRRSLERNRRSTFARSAKSTLASWISAGGDLRGLNAEEVTRDPLLAQIREARGGDETTHKLERYRNAIVRLITREARGDPDTARSALESTIEALQVELDVLSANGNRAPVSAIVTHETGRKAREARIASSTTGHDPLSMTGVIRTRPAHARMSSARA